MALTIKIREPEAPLTVKDATQLDETLEQAAEEARKRGVVVGFSRHVRNPMAEGFAVGWIGLWIVFGPANLLSMAPSQQLPSCICS